MTIFVAGDNLAWGSVNKALDYLAKNNYSPQNLGAKSAEDTISLQVFIPKLCKAVLDEENSQGILLCGTGAGVEIGANRFKGIRASLCLKPIQAEWARNKDNANVLCLSSWDLEESNNLSEILDTWFKTTYDGSKTRLKMLAEFDKFA